MEDRENVKEKETSKTGVEEDDDEALYKRRLIWCFSFRSLTFACAGATTAVRRPPPEAKDTGGR
jgi:hypothetical protein